MKEQIKNDYKNSNITIEKVNNEDSYDLENPTEEIFS